MADLGNQRALAVTKQSAVGTYNAPTNSDLIPASNLSWRANAIQTDNPEYTGSIHRVGPIVLGATYEVTATILLRGPGGAAPPAANAFILGRILQACGFTENILSTAVPAAAEAGTAGTTSSLTLGAGAAATADLYKGLAIKIPALGTSPLDMTMIRAYSAAKVALFAETAGASITGNYQIPKQIAYTLAATGTPPSLSLSLWEGARRYNFMDAVPTSARLVFPTSSRESQDYSRLEVTFSCDLQSYIDEAAPAIPALGAIPPFKGGKLHVAGLSMGGSSISVDLGLRAAYPNNPNKASGSDAAQLVETRRTLQLDLNQVAKSYLDLMALASGQSNYPIQAMFGFYPGNYVGFVATDARLNFPNTNEGGDFVTTTGEAYVDSADKSLSLVFPYA